MPKTTSSKNLGTIKIVGIVIAIVVVVGIFLILRYKNENSIKNQLCLQNPDYCNATVVNSTAPTTSLQTNPIVYVNAVNFLYIFNGNITNSSSSKANFTTYTNTKFNFSIYDRGHTNTPPNCQLYSLSLDNGFALISTSPLLPIPISPNSNISIEIYALSPQNAYTGPLTIREYESC
jgi:hypothetical protein